MKNLILTILILALSTTTFAGNNSKKSYKTVKSKIETYQEWKIDQMYYTLSDEELIRFARSYYRSYRYRFVGMNENSINLYKIKHIRTSASTFSRSRVTTGERQTNTTINGGTYVTCVTKPYVKETRQYSYHTSKATHLKIEKIKHLDGYKLNVEKENGNGIVSSYTGKDFKKALYVYVHGNDLAIPKALVEEIEAHNTLARKKHQIPVRRTNLLME